MHKLTKAEKSQGGKSTSPAKLAAARRNLEHAGGRPAKWETLGEYIMRKPLTREQFEALEQAWHRLRMREKDKFLKVFHLDWKGYYPNMADRSFERGSLKPELLKLFRYMARWEMRQK